jgi:hypothetical protein
MQAYVHKDGKTLGPYTVRELKERVEKGILLPDDQASYDGQNWVKISQVPGFESSIPPPPPPPASVPPSVDEHQGAAERAKSLAGNLFKKSKETVEKIAASEQMKQAKEKASDVSSKIAASDQVKQAKKKASEAKEKITSSDKFRSLKERFKFKPDDKE